jgi:hypothetical protein
MDKLTRDFVESSALFDELMSIYTKGERALQKKMRFTKMQPHPAEIKPSLN